MTRNEVRQVLLYAWAELMPAIEDDARMDYWVWEWIQRYWPAEREVLDMGVDDYA